MLSVALLLLRLVVGLLFIGHGAQKLFGWFGGHGIQGTAGWFKSLGLRRAPMLTVLAGLSELGGGLLLALGFLNPLGSLGIIASMIMAIALVHWPKIWVTENGFEYPLVNLTAAAAIALAGPGIYSLDAVAYTELPMPQSFFIGLIAVIAASVLILRMRSKPVEKKGQQKAAA